MTVPDDTTAGPLGTLQGGAVAVPAPTGQTVSIPSTIADNCSQNVSGPLKHWLNKLPAETTVLVPAQACYQVDKGLTLNDRQDLTIYGGTYTSEGTAPGKAKNSKGKSIFNLIGGSNISLESMKINGKNSGGYHPALAFSGGIDVQGTNGITIKGVTITDTFGDGIEFAPLRAGADHKSGTITAQTKNAVVDGLTVIGAGRQAVTLTSISGAQISDLIVQDPGINTFDVEADQGNEGAENVTIDGCTSSGGGIFFANGGAGSAKYTGNITVEHCAMAKTTAGYAILSQAHGRTTKQQRGPLDFVADTLYCGDSAYVACVQLSGAEATIEDSVLYFPGAPPYEDAYRLSEHAGAVFKNDKVDGYGRRGLVSKNSTVAIHGGHWVSATGGT